MGSAVFSRPAAIYLGHCVRLLGWLPFVISIPTRTLLSIGTVPNCSCPFWFEKPLLL
jgi:hypothetical protein